MLKRTRYMVIVVLLAWGTTTLFSQNLVPNPDFETFSFCPTYISQIQLATGWASPTDGTPDYYHRCNSNLIVGVPINDQGVQNAHSGEGYSGIHTYTVAIPDRREYIQTRLTQPLTQGTSYRVEFWVSLADTMQFALDKIGAYFSSGPISQASWDYLPFSPQVENPQGNILDQYDQWQKVSGTFTANGGESYITIGNFRPDNQTTIVSANPTRRNYSYYYIDDISVIPLDSNLSIITDTTICERSTITLFGSGATNYQWENLAEPGIVIGTEDSLSVSPMETTTYLLIGDGDSATVTVTVLTGSNYSVGWPDTMRICNFPFLLDAETPGASYRWQDNSGAPTFLAEQEGNYSVEITTQCGQFYGHTYLDSLETGWFANNVFTPNGDNINDFFAVELVNTDEYQVEVFTRWGKRIFFSEGKGKHWDGRFEGKKMPQGVYFWILSYTDCSGKSAEVSGNITLLR